MGGPGPDGPVRPPATHRRTSHEENAMEHDGHREPDPAFLRNALASFVQIALLAALMWACFSILAPFLGLVTWGIIIAVAIHPLHVRLTRLFRGRVKVSATLLVVAGLAVLLVPAWTMTGPTVSSVRAFADSLEAGTVKVPPPSPKVEGWPVAGPRVYEAWSAASKDLQATLDRYQPQLKVLGGKLVRMVGALAMGVLQFFVAMIMAGVFLAGAESGSRTARAIATRMAGARGDEFVTLSVATIRSVTKGILGVALIQAALAAVGLLVMRVPAAMIWAAITMVLAILQIPTLLVLGPVAAWVFTSASTVPAIIFAVFVVAVGMLDSILKPILLGRGVDVPMIVIFVGAIGGAIAGGLVGLFVGSVVLAVGYKVVVTWMTGAPGAVGAAGGPGAGPTA